MDHRQMNRSRFISRMIGVTKRSMNSYRSTPMATTSILSRPPEEPGWIRDRLKYDCAGALRDWFRVARRPCRDAASTKKEEWLALPRTNHPSRLRHRLSLLSLMIPRPTRRQLANCQVDGSREVCVFRRAAGNSFPVATFAFLPLLSLQGRQGSFKACNPRSHCPLDAN